MSYLKSIWIIAFVLLQACNSVNTDQKLPYLGRKQIMPVTENGVIKYDTTYHTIADFSFINQDSSIVTNHTFKGDIYVADFFFTTCPTICPIMKAQMLRVYDKFEDYDEVKILSHTIDPVYDTVGVLRDFADRLGVSSEMWHFVTGNKEDIFNIGQSSYMVTAIEDKDEPGGYIHSGAFILVDKQRRIRGLYDGTDEKEVNRLIKDIPRLLKEYD